MRLSQAFFVVAAATLALAQDALVSKAIFSGKDTTRDDAHGADLYKHLDNYPAAAASLLVYAADRVNYLPYEAKYVKSIVPYYEFEAKLHRFAGFKVNELSEPILLATGDRGDLYEAVKAAYDGVENKIIAATIRNLVPKTTTENLESLLLSVPVIRRDSSSGRVTIKLALLDLLLETDDDGQVSIVAGQTASFTVTEFELQFEFLHKHADRIAEGIRDVYVDGYKLFFTNKQDDEQVSKPSKDDLWFHLESPSQVSFLERLRKAWNMLRA